MEYHSGLNFDELNGLNMTDHTAVKVILQSQKDGFRVWSLYSRAAASGEVSAARNWQLLLGNLTNTERRHVKMMVNYRSGRRPELCSVAQVRRV